MTIVKEYHEDLESFSARLKQTKVTAVYFYIDVKSEDITGTRNVALPDGTNSQETVRGLKMVSSMAITAITPKKGDREVVPTGQQAGQEDRTFFVYEQAIAAMNCFEDAQYDEFNNETRIKKDEVLGKIHNAANVILYPGRISPVVE